MKSGNVFAFMTATAVDPDTSEEQHGWVDPGWSRTKLHDSRNDVGALCSVSLDLDGFPGEDGEEELFGAVMENLGGARDNGDGSFYGDDEWQDPSTGVYWTYAVHFVRKFPGDSGWVEEPYRPAVLTHQDYPHQVGTLPGCYACEFVGDRA